MNPVSVKVQVPVELLSYVQQHKLVKTFQVFMYMKCMSASKMRNTDAAFTGIAGALAIKDRRTLNKHINRLAKLNWIGFNPETGEYYIRGIGFIRKQQGFKKRKAATFYFKDVKEMQAFVAGSIISANIKAQQYFWEVAPRTRRKSATMNMDVARQDGSCPSDAMTQKPAYYGIGVKGIAKLLFCKATRACELKQEAEKAGFIKTRKKFREIGTYHGRNHKLKEAYGYAHPNKVKAIRFKTVTRKKKKFVVMLEQLHDEIKPNVPFKKVKRFLHL